MSLDDLKNRVTQESEPDVTPSTQEIVTHERKLIKVTTRELKEAIAANPEHKVAKVYNKALRTKKDGNPIFVELVDLQALLNNQEVVIESHQGQDGPVTTKTLLKGTPFPKENPKPFKPSVKEPAKEVS